MFSMTFRCVTRRLVIRRMHPDDWQDLYAYLSDPDTVRYEPYEPYTRQEARLEAANRANCPEFLAVCLLTNGRMIGNLYVSCHREDGCEQGSVYELGYIFNRKYRGKNYAFESCNAIMQLLWKNSGTGKIFAECDARNTRSRHLMERLGMQMEATFSGEDFTGEQKQALHCRYSILRTD